MSRAAKTTTPAALCGDPDSPLPRIAPSATLRLSVEAPDVDSFLARWAWFHNGSETWGFLTGCGPPSGLDAKEGALAKARGVVATANQKPGRRLAGGGKAKALQIWRERGLALLLLVCSLFGSLT